MAATAAATGGPETQQEASTLAQNEATSTAAESGLAAADALHSVVPALLTEDAPGLPAVRLVDSLGRRRLRVYRPSRLFVGVVYAPELSTVGREEPGRLGYSSGVQVEYQLRPRLRLSVALLRSMKYYQAASQDYTWPTPPTYAIDYVDAVCRITDIPVNLRYDVWQGARYRAFAGLGLSSLLMRDEQYSYTYLRYNRPYTRTWQVSKGSRHPFSVVNVSAGLERQLTAHWALRAEPYLKLPLGGVGAGKVRLNSAGVFFGLHYGL